MLQALRSERKGARALERAATTADSTRRWREENRERINAAKRVVPRYVYDSECKSYVPNPSAGPKSKAR